MNQAVENEVVAQTTEPTNVPQGHSQLIEIKVWDKFPTAKDKRHNIFGKYFCMRTTDDIYEASSGNMYPVREFLWPDGQWRLNAIDVSGDKNAYFETEQEIHDLLVKVADMEPPTEVPQEEVTKEEIQQEEANMELDRQEVEQDSENQVAA